MQGLHRSGSMFSINPFGSNKPAIKKELKNIIDEVTGVKKVCMTSRSSLLNILHGLDGDKTNSPWWKIGESLTAAEKDFKQGQGALLREAVTSTTESMKKLAACQVTFESELQGRLTGERSPIHSMIYRDYPVLQREKDGLRQKQKEVDAMASRHAKERQRIKQLRDSEKETDEGLAEKESRLVDEKDNAEKEASQAEDKLATTLYTLQAKEKDLALNIVDSLKTLQTFFRSVLNHLDQDIPALEEKVKNSAKTRVYGEDLAAHLRSHKRSIATPLSLGVKGLKNNLTEEGLFRIAPSIPTFKKLKAFIDSGGSEEDVLKKYKDPHIYTAFIKYYLRELPDPLFCSAFARQWATTNAIKDDRRRMKEIDRLLDEIPTANKRNIEFLFKFLAQLTVEEVTNKMSISNLVVVLGPNLLWDDSLKTVSLENVCRSLIEVWSSRHFLRARSESEQDLLCRGESVVEHWEGEGILEVTARSEAARADIKERRKQIIEESSLEIAEERRLDEDIDLFNKPTEDEEDRSENKSWGLLEETEGGCSELSNWQPASEPKTSLDNLLKMPTLDEDNIAEFLQIEENQRGQLEIPGDDCSGVIIRGGRDERGGGESVPGVPGGEVGAGRGGGGGVRRSLGGGGGAMGARNALLSASKSSPGLLRQTQTRSLQTPTIHEGSTSPERRPRSMIPKFAFRRSRPPSFETNP